MQFAAIVTVQVGEVLGSSALSTEELAISCGVEADWVRQRMELGVLQGDASSGEWRFDSAALVRARRLLALETTFDADPQLAALTADLIEEVLRLKRTARPSDL